MAKAKAKVKFDIAPHKDAPLFTADEKENQLIVAQAIAEMGANMSTSEQVRDVIRQLGLVSLWFFERYIAGHSGPYNKLNDGIHLIIRT